MSANPYRSHTCNDLRASHAGQTVRLAGWIHNKRDLGGVLFIDLRDHYGITQIVIPPTAAFQNEVGHLPKETVISVSGDVRLRPGDTKNPNLDTGDIELDVAGYDKLGSCEALPMNVFPEDHTPEETRLKYRFLDLRRSKLHKTVMLRAKVISTIRRRMIELGFQEFQTPILTSSSPEGARDFLVPSRLYPGEFYALPQAPQQFKQLLMVSGFDRYFQIAPCFRDEDGRADRTPGEFYQLDVEMSFVTQDDVFRRDRGADGAALQGIQAEWPQQRHARGHVRAHSLQGIAAPLRHRQAGHAHSVRDFRPDAAFRSRVSSRRSQARPFAPLLCRRLSINRVRGLIICRKKRRSSARLDWRM